MQNRKKNSSIKSPEPVQTVETVQPVQATTTQPFIDINLERKILRHLIFDHRYDNQDIEKEIASNIGYVVGVGETREVFSDDFNKKIFDEIVGIFIKHSQSTTRLYLCRFMDEEYKSATKDEFDKQMILFEEIFAHKFEVKNFKMLFDDIKDKYHYRTLHTLNFDINNKLRRIFDKSLKKTPVEMANDIEDIVGKIILSTGKSRILEQDIFQTVDSDIALLRAKREHPKDFEGIPTGFERIDTIMGGFFPGELIIVLGRPSAGKSVLLLNFATNAYMQNYNVIYVTLEMPLEQQKQRFYSLLTKTDYSKLKFPHRMEPEEIDHIEKMVSAEKNKHKNFLWFIDAPQQCTTAFLESRISAFENLIGKHCDLLVVDPLYFMSPTIQPQDGDFVGQVAVDLKFLGRKFKMPIIAASQTNRAGGARHRRNESADTSDAAFSDKIGQCADNVIFITGDRSKDDGLAKLQFAKTRDSKMSSLVFQKRFDIMKFIYEINSSKPDAVSTTEAES